MQLSVVLIKLALVLPFAARAFAAPLTVTIPDTQDVDGLVGPLGAENIFKRQDLSLDGVNVPVDVPGDIPVLHGRDSTDILALLEEILNDPDAELGDLRKRALIGNPQDTSAPVLSDAGQTVDGAVSDVVDVEKDVNSAIRQGPGLASTVVPVRRANVPGLINRRSLLSDVLDDANLDTLL